MKPVIAITPMPASLTGQAARAARFERSLRAAGAEPRWLTLDDPGFATADGVLLVGGGDPAEPYYDGALTAAERATLTHVDPRLDEYELAVLAAAFARDQPVLGVCRGMQLLNLALGGSLAPDIRLRHPAALEHQHPDPVALAHPVAWVAATRLGKLLGESCAWVTSSHHQALDRMGTGLVVAGRAPDGIIEAVEQPAARFCCGVQFHPERMTGGGAVFAAFVSAATS